MMDFKNIKVLVTDGSGKQPIAMIRGLKEIGCRVAVICGDKLDSCYVSNQPDEKILQPGLREMSAEEKLAFYLSLLEGHRFDAIMPIGERSTDFVTSHAKEIAPLAVIACAPREVYYKTFNKQLTFDQAIDSGVPCPVTRHSKEDLEHFLSRVTFPIIVKPREGLGSIGFHKFKTEEEFREKLKDPSFRVDDYVVQEFVQFDRRVGVNMFVDPKGNVCTAYAVEVLRWFPVDAGASCFSHTVDAPDAIAHAARLLKDMGWQGFANMGFMIDKNTGEYKLLEINGRISASIRIGYILGYNISRQMMEMVYGQDVVQYPVNTQFDRYFRHFDTDFAWFLRSPDRFRARPSWFSWKNTTELLYYKDDRRPFYSNFFQRTFRYRKIMKEKQH